MKMSFDWQLKENICRFCCKRSRAEQMACCLTNDKADLTHMQFRVSVEWERQRVRSERAEIVCVTILDQQGHK